MKKIVFVIFFIFNGIVSTNGQEKETFTLTVKISGLKSNKGTIIIGLYNNKLGFLKNEYKGDVVEIKEKRATIIFKNIDAGEYAVSFIHDENKNNKMDTNFFGIPKEDYGCSNNAKSFMGPPKYEDAKFMLSENKTILIGL
tara:strand:+ start:1940 stop:2362 length:423 start_codon:yes stop_codon:yes gene_type:complete